MESDTRIILGATPKLAKVLSHRYLKLSVDEVKTVLQSNHGRALSRGDIQKVSETVGALAQAKEEHWHYSTPVLDAPVATVSIGPDGTTIYLRKRGYRIAMVGTLALWDEVGSRLRTTYIGASPEWGKRFFLTRMTQEIEHIKLLYPDALSIGLADGTTDNGSFLNVHTSIQITDFWQASEYLAQAAEAIFPRQRDCTQKKLWLDEHCHKFKHLNGANTQRPANEHLIDKQTGEAAKGHYPFYPSESQDALVRVVVKQARPIGSSVTETACKTIVKQRLCQSGMKWNE